MDQGGSLGELDYIELENHNLIIGNDTLGYRFTYSLTTVFNANSPNKKEDRLNLNFWDQSLAADTDIQLNYLFGDSIKCTSMDCNFADTLKVQNTDFRGVYYSPRRNTTNLNALYMNSANGLVGFKTRDNLIFELIP